MRTGAVLLLVMGLALGLATAPARAPAQTKPIPLEIKGGNATVVQVPRVITTTVDQLVVNTFPFLVQAPPDPKALYFWTYPPLVPAADQGDTLKVTAAPRGELTVSVKIVTPDLDKDGKFLGYITRFGSTTFYVGEVTPGPGPGPKPPDPKPPDPKPTGDLRVLFVRET